MQGAINSLKDLYRRAESEVESIIEECGTGCDLNHTQDSVFRIRRVLTAVEDLFIHARLGVDYFIEAHEQHRLKHQITQDNTTST